ncbi:MAG: hypothetical protein HY681_14265 [Chloroflexi bacterium]|nr:hypothetical protein [Chloroflexota bacterium]
MVNWKRLWIWASPLVVLAVACGGAAAPTATAASQPASTATVVQPTAAPGQPTATRPLAQPTAAATPVASTKPEGSITLAVSVLPSSVDHGLVCCGGNEYVFNYAHYDRLLKRDFKGKLVNSLATDWSVTPDGLHYTFKIRQGVKFHNGEDLTAEDVQHAEMRHFQPNSRSNNPPRTKVDTVDVVDPYTVRFNLKAPVFIFPNYLDYLLGITPKDYITKVGDDEFGRRAIGSGPFKLKEFKIAQEISLEANEGYWGKVPEFKDLRILVVPEAGTRVAMLKTGQADMVTELPPFLIEGVEKTAGLGVISTPTSEVQVIFFNYMPQYAGTDHPTLKKDVRWALNLAIDREAMVKAFLRGRGRPAATETADFINGAVTGLKYPYDPAEAKKRLAAAGFPNGVDLGTWFYTTGTATMDEASVALSQYWSVVGIKVQWQRVDAGSTTALVNNKTIPPREINDSITTYDAESDLALFWNSTAVFSAFYNGKHDALINAASAEMNPAVRTQKLQKVVQTIYDEADSIPVYFLDKVYGINTKKISGWEFVEGFAFPRNLEYLHRR